MKKNGIINSSIASVLSLLGHTDTIVICDAGLPIPLHINRIDLVLRKGMPSFMDVLKEVLLDMEVESIILAEEIRKENSIIEGSILSVLAGLPVEYISHDYFKKQTSTSKAIIRTGEMTPYANIILKAGVLF